MSTCPGPSVPPRHAAPRRAAITWFLAACAAALPAQSDPKPEPAGPPVALSPGEWESVHRGVRPRVAGGIEARDLEAAGAPRLPVSQVILDRQGDRVWAVGSSYKACFDADGFCYVPFLGADVESDHPVRFVVERVRVAGRELQLGKIGSPVVEGQVVSLDRGVLREEYRVGLEQVEQVFVVEAPSPGDVVVDLRVHTDLTVDPTGPHTRFVHERGAVDYGTAYVVTDGAKTAIVTERTTHGLRLTVPAAARSGSTVVIDPILSTTGTSFSGRPNDSLFPDISYDATNDRYLVVWQYAFSATDHDIFAELRDGNGGALPGQLMSIDASFARESLPRVANVNAADRFVIVYEKRDAGSAQGRSMLWARLVDAASPIPVGGSFLISDPTVGPGNNVAPDVAGDGGTGTFWCVAWTLEISPTESWIVARTFDASGNATNALQTYVEQNPNRIFANVSLSSTNAAGVWCLAYGALYMATDWDVYGVTIDAGAAVVTRAGLDVSNQMDRYPTVSAPAIRPSGDVMFMVTYERESVGVAQASIFDIRLRRATSVDLTLAFGVGRYWVRCESDGCRFAVTGADPAPASAVANFGVLGTTFYPCESPQRLPGTPEFLRLCSKGAHGGIRTDYAIAFVDSSATPDAIRITSYSGHQQGTTFYRRATACGSLGLSVTGRPFLGERVQFGLTNAGGLFSGLLFGIPTTVSNAWCPACQIGVNLAGPTATFSGTLVAIPIPCDVGLVGTRLAAQGFAVNNGPCSGGLVFSDTIEMNIR